MQHNYLWVIFMIALLCVAVPCGYSAHFQIDGFDDAVSFTGSDLFVIDICPAGDFVLTDPIGRRIRHEQGKKGSY
jgi:hypothetical protein